MELRHLRYFVAVVEEGSFTVAAEKRLHTAQPSLSRQIRDLEYEVGATLLTRGVRGVEMTDAGRAFYQHAQLALSQVDAAVQAARRADQQPKSSFALGFLTGQEMKWLPSAMRIFHQELPDIEVTISSQYSPDLADALVKGRLDLAFLPAEPGRPELAYIPVFSEPIIVLMPSDHPLAARTSVPLAMLAKETFIGIGNKATVLKAVIDNYLHMSGVALAPDQVVDNVSMAISMVASKRGVALMPTYALDFLPWSVTSRPLEGTAPAIDLVVGYHKSNTSPLLKLFLSRKDDLIKGAAPHGRPGG